MPVTDPIADLLTRLRNAARANKYMISMPYSKAKESICNVLKKSNYIKEVSSVGAGIAKELVIELDDMRSDIHLKRMSKPGQRIYVKTTEIPNVLEGLGLAILSTPKGVMSGRDAKKARVGGEYLCEVY